MMTGGVTCVLYHPPPVREDPSIPGPPGAVQPIPVPSIRGPWLAGLQRSIPVRSRHSRAAASAPASLPFLTVPLRVRLGRAPRRQRRIDPLGARPLQERISAGRGAPLADARDLAPAHSRSARRDFFPS